MFLGLSALAIALMVTTPATAHEGLPDEGDTGLVHACTKTSRKGKVRMRFVSPTGACRRQWTPTHWRLAHPAAGTLLSLTFTGTSVKPRRNDVTHDNSGSGGCAFASAGNAFTVWNVPVVLPNGSIVRLVRMHFNDTSASNSTAWFTKYDLEGTIVSEYPVSSVGDAGVGFSDSAAIDETIDYDAHSYLINWRPGVVGSEMQLCAFQIFYEPPPA